MRVATRSSAFSILFVLALVSCGGPTITESPVPVIPDPAALMRTSMESTVGVVLDELSFNQRERLVGKLKTKSESFWKDRAIRQIRLTSHRLNFGGTGMKKQSPLPPEQLWSIAIRTEPKRETINGHDTVTVSYAFSGVLLTDTDSPGISITELGQIGGIWDEPFQFPVDPEFVFQRTGFACMNESQFPPNSFDAEEVDLFFNQRCRTEQKLTNTGCHQTALPTLSCPQALMSGIGKIDTSMRFERLPWDATIADAVRIGKVTNPEGPDLVPSMEEFVKHRFNYRYIPENSCTIVESCVGGTGWRHLLQFPTGDINVGAKPLEIGRVDYFNTHSGTVLSQHGVFEFSACHGHYHFSEYGSFTVGNGSDTVSHKNAFCLQPSGRVWNHELSPLHHDFVDCIDQGDAVGWIDEYKMGLECQWLDISDVKPNRDLPLSFTTNPEGLLCEGTLKKNAQGRQKFERTSLKTKHGDPVDRPVCEQYSAWKENNTISYNVHIPEKGESYVTDTCREGLFGPLRNCGLKNAKILHECVPGTKVRLKCNIPAKSVAQVVRICEGSRALQSGIPCTYNDSLGSGVVETSKNISFICPAARDGIETGGVYSLLTGSLFPDEATTEVTCVQKE
ncbi:hypothetical protein EXS70_00820 [Candidatus Peribacteria bacterium]|nr:hypothetical protein [Candidatus Peribacteria bacterium]